MFRVGNLTECVDMIKIKKLKPTDRDYLLRDEKKVLVDDKKGVVIGKGVDSLMKFIDNRKHNYDAIDCMAKIKMAKIKLAERGAGKGEV